MARLIDADALMEELRKENQICITSTSHELSMSIIYSFIENQPTAFDVDKVVEELENEKKFWEDSYDYQLGKEKARSYEHAIELVREGGVE